MTATPLCVSLHAGEGKPEREAPKEKLGDWMGSYYTTHNLARFDEYWTATIKLRALEAAPAIQEITIGFLSQIFRQNPALLKERIKNIDQFPEKERDAVRLILWWVDSDYSRELLRQNGDQDMLKYPPPGVEHHPILRSEDISFCIGWFDATGDTKALQPLLTMIKESRWKTDDPRPGYAVINLQSFCRRDANVKAFVEKFLKSENLSGDARAVTLFILDQPAGFCGFLAANGLMHLKNK